MRQPAGCRHRPGADARTHWTGACRTPSRHGRRDREREPRLDPHASATGLFPRWPLTPGGFQVWPLAGPDLYATDPQPGAQHAMIPGEYKIQDGEIELNAGRRTLTLSVANCGDRPIQVGSHYHFFETNDALAFDRAAARGMRLNIPAGTAGRFEPGQSREVELVELAGQRRVFGFAGRVMGAL